MQLSLLSRTTSISNSFQPRIDSSIKSSLVGDKSSPLKQISTNSSLLYAIPPPVPPIVNEGLIIVGNPTVSCTLWASSRLCATAALGMSKPIFSMALRNNSLSSALSIASFFAPIISTLFFCKIP